jgi:ribosomal protein S18 acetylase RimI-like enzyme
MMEAMPADAISIRPAIPQDRPFLVSLNRRLVAEAALPGFDAADFASFQEAHTEKALKSASLGSATFVAVDANGVPLGYLHLETVIDELSGSNEAYVSIIAVRLQADRKGVGARLMAAASTWAEERGYRYLLLDVFASNRTARAFYERCGFVEDSLRLRRAVGPV